MKVLVVNSGSSSVKYRLFDGQATVAKGLVERIGEDGGQAPDHEAALGPVLDSLDLTELAAVGHRVVHGGDRFTQATVGDDDVVATIELLPQDGAAAASTAAVTVPAHGTASVPASLWATAPGSALLVRSAGGPLVALAASSTDRPGGAFALALGVPVPRST